MSKIPTYIIVLILIGVGYASYRWYDSSKPEPDTEIMLEEGDYATVNYTGWLKDPRMYGDTQRVFDTSKEDVGTDGLSFPKTSSYRDRDTYSTFRFQVGVGQVISGWDNNILGMKEGDTAKWTILPSDAYEPRFDELVLNISREENTTIYETYDLGYLQARYPSTNLAPGLTLRHFFWDWDIMVESISPFDNTVTIFNMPILNQDITSLYGFESEVTYIQQSDNQGLGKIVVRHNPSTGDLVYTSTVRSYRDNIMKLADYQNQQGGVTDGIVVEITQDEVSMDFNLEVYGRTLVFDVTLLTIEKGD
jgi:FKBP-type peptidyl-prolyl cis-trans isomerase 2